MQTLGLSELNPLRSDDLHTVVFLCLRFSHLKLIETY